MTKLESEAWQFVIEEAVKDIGKEIVGKLDKLIRLQVEANRLKRVELLWDGKIMASEARVSALRGRGKK